MPRPAVTASQVQSSRKPHTRKKERKGIAPNLPAPFAAFLASLVAVARLFLITQTTFVTGLGQIGGGTIIEHLFFGYGTLDPNVGIHLLFATMVLWMTALTPCWLVLSLFGRKAER